MAQKMKRYLKNAISALCAALISVQPLMAQSIVADGGGPQVIDTANGLPMVMIQTPDANGVSHNTFTEFGVGAGGAILNNVDTNTATTQLGGIIQGNSNLTGGAAGVILNEVTSTNPSVMNGFLEVGGQRADVIVANPNGITCDGCGFINTNRLTITTGTPTFEGERFTGFSVDNGAVRIGQSGLDASDTTTFDLLSREVRVGGVVSGQRIRIVAGRNDIVYATREVTAKPDDGSTKPSLAIDSTALGGMFANSITITSTEEGVGVRAPQNMAANAGGMTITADGRLVMNNASATQNVTVRAEEVEVRGDVVAQQNVDVTSAEDLVLAANAKLVADSAAILTVGRDLDVGANAELTATRFDFDITGAFRVGGGADVVSAETMRVEVDSLMNFGTLASTEGGLLVTTSLDLTNEGLMFGDTSLVLRSDETITNRGGSIVSNSGITIGGDDNTRADAFINQFGGVVETVSGNISIAALSFRNERDGPDLAAGVTTAGDQGEADCERDTCYEEIREDQSITFTSDASRIISAGDITINAGDAVNAFSTISAFGDINIAANSLTNIGQNYYRDNGGGLEFIGADFGVIEAGGDINGTAISGYVFNGAATALTDDRARPTDVDLTDVNVDDIGNPDLLIPNEDPDADFLVETRPEFVDLDQFVSSDYFLSAIQYDPELRRFGDAYAEALLIRKQLQELLGQLILITGVDERRQIEAMYNNAINELENLDLTPGVALTPDQIGALTSDIIWLEETVIDGQRVLAPKVYLANPEIRFAGLSGAMITGRNVDFRTDNFDNAGSIRATDTISIAVSDTFRSTGGTVSAENIAVVGNNIEIVTDARTVVTERGIRLIRLPNANPAFARLFANSGWTDQEDRALQTARFEAGSTIVLTARDAITTAGAEISAGDNITLIAGGDITIGALALVSETGKTSGSNRDRVERFDNLTTSLTAGGDIMLLSSGNASGQNDIVLEGANLTAGGDVGLIAQDGDLVLAAVRDVYFRDRARKSGNFFRKKIRRSQTLDVTNQVTTITGASITGVAANNILVEGSRFTIPGVPNDDLAPGQLSLVSVNGSSAFTAPTDVRARSSYKSTRYLGGLITNSRDSRSLITSSVGAVADAAGDINLNSGADLTLTAVDFTVGGEFVTQVTGTTYLLAAIDVEYDFLVEHKDNGVIMTDIRAEDITENVTFNAIEAAGGVNFDINSQIVLAGVRNPLIDGTHPGGWVAENEDTGRFNIADAYLGGPQDADGDDSNASTDPHWREGGEWSEEGAFLVQQIALPTGADGAEYAYLDGVLGRDDTINEPIELVSYSFYEKERALSPAFKALLTIAVTQGMAGLEFLQIAQSIGVSATNTALTTAVNTATQSFAATMVVETADGVVAGDVDAGDILGEASFSAVSAGLTSGVNLDTFGGSFEGMAWAETSLFQAAGFGSQFTVAGFVEAGIDATLTAGLTTAVYDDTDFLDAFGSSLESAAINLAMADLQQGIGDGVEAGFFEEGDFEHALLHGVVGCAAGEALGGSCGSGAAAGIAQSVFAGIAKDFAPDETDGESYAAWRASFTNRAELVGATAGFLTSGGVAENVSGGGSIAKSGFLNNYLYHDEAVRRQAANERLWACQSSGECSAEEIAQLWDTIQELNALDAERDRQFKMACLDMASAACAIAFADLSAAHESFAVHIRAGTLDSRLLFSEYTHGGIHTGIQQETDGRLGVGDLFAAYKSEVLQNAYFDALQQIPVDAVTGTIDLASITAAAVAGDETAQQQLELIGQSIWAAVTDPVGTVQAGYEDVVAKLDEARALEEAGDWHGAAQILGDLSATVTVTTASAGTAGVALKALNAVPGLPNRVLPEGSPYPQADYDAYVQRKLDAGEIPRSPEGYVEVRQRFDKGSAAHNAAVEAELDLLRETYGENARLIENRAVSAADGCSTCRPDIMVYDPDTRTLHVIEVKTGDADLTPNQRQIYPEIANGSASMNSNQLSDLGLPTEFAGRPLSEIDGLKIVVEEVRH
ncbi:filamentous hemagglutinin N-terminal domain-containing protein [Cognatiyoonia sp. IB215446]|uniref:two-partner secretion domain-containing protein n=1 Tax=Cognatiyoonia sp. IB215446 TaxID=3097355 RepID=UPI002A1003FA|nr:filamentous hemagglutinin N-terminal domain-containing protein [Cognatiyoonia sp. IB215446]MDX8350525.1 filamentous hemagglutinin N-terminal domain-containing protein [Cognatiyoonia sp. IB215446]